MSNIIWGGVQREWEQQFIDEFDNNQNFDEEDLDILATECDYKMIEGCDHRWQKEIQSIIKINDRLFAIDWMQGLTESQENSFYNQPYEVIETKKQITITEYKKLKIESEIIKYRKKPVVIEAIKFNGKNFKECTKFIDKNYDNTLSYPNVRTLSGTVSIEFGDYIIKGINGEFYPCKPDIFKKTYDEVGDDE